LFLQARIKKRLEEQKKNIKRRQEILSHQPLPNSSSYFRHFSDRDRLMVDVVIRRGTYVSEVAVNKQLAHKEKVVCALLDQCLETQARGVIAVYWVQSA
jgi:chorismate mutase